MVDYEKTETMLTEIRKIIDRAVVVRERGNIVEAQNLLMQAQDGLDKMELRNQASFEDIENMRVDVFSHMIICFKHLYENTGNKSFLSGMEASIMRGLNLDVSESRKSVFYLRMGDLFALRGEPIESYLNYHEAYKRVPKGTVAEVEYQGHLGLANANIGHYQNGINALNQAINKLDNFPELEEWHRLIILSGLYARLAKVHYGKGRYGIALCDFFESYKLSRRLASEFKMPQRLNQIHRELRLKFLLRHRKNPE